MDKLMMGNVNSSELSKELLTGVGYINEEEYHIRMYYQYIIST